MKKHCFKLVFLFLIGTVSMAQSIASIKGFDLELSENKGKEETLIIYLTGDGGWNNFSQSFVQEFETNGYGVVTLNTRKYFWDKKTPQQFAQDLETIANHFLKQWKKQNFILIGYSFGADVAAFIPNRISPNLKGKLHKLVLMSPSLSSDFEIKLSDMVDGAEKDSRKYKVEPEIKGTELTTVCIFGEDEELLLKRKLINSKNILIHKLPGNHQYKNNYSLLVKIIQA